jgi:hypothetical protein
MKLLPIPDVVMASASQTKAPNLFLTSAGAVFSGTIQVRIEGCKQIS